MTIPARFSPHFTRREMEASDTAARWRIDNALPAALVPSMVRTCEALEQVRARFGPIHVSSGYRCPRLNRLIGGSTTSAHMLALAGDFQPIDPAVTLREVVEFVSREMAVDQVIYEYGAWVHLGLADLGKTPRGQALMIFHGSGYLQFDPLDPRVVA